MDEKIILDPRKIIGEITVNSPYFIVEYVAKMCKIPYNSVHLSNDSYRSDVIKIINESEFSIINLPSENSDESDLKKIVRFISPFLTSEDWFSDCILDGFYHLMSFEISLGNLPHINKTNFSVGQKTVDYPLSLNEILVFRIATHHKYSYDKNTTLAEFNFFVEKIVSRKTNNLKNSLLHSINALSDADLIKIYYTTINLTNSIDENKEEEVADFKFPTGKESKIDFDQNYLNVSSALLFNSKKTITRIKPKNQYEAIIYAAIKYNINISTSSNPLKELDNLKKSKYIPNCVTLSQKFSINSRYFYLNRTWVEYLSNSNIYTVEQLKNFALEEGFINVSGLSFNELHSYLKSTKNMVNIYFGKHPECKENVSSFSLTPLKEIPDEEIFCFGIEKTGDLGYISIDDLCEFLSYMKMYVDPIKNQPVDDRVIRKIKLFCNNATGDLVKKTRKLLEIMGEVDKIKKLVDTKVRDLKIKITNCNLETREAVDYFFQKCMEMGLYMRGWKINPNVDYPLLSQDTVFDEGAEIEPDPGIDISIYGEGFKYTVKQKIIDNSVKCLDESVEILKEIPIEIANDIRSLQTVKFTDNGIPQEIMGYIIRGAYTYQNETLIDCMRSIYKGMEDDDACIRSNSAWILFTSAWYRLLFEFHVPFRIDKIQTTR